MDRKPLPTLFSLPPSPPTLWPMVPLLWLLLWHVWWVDDCWCWLLLLWCTITAINKFPLTRAWPCSSSVPQLISLLEEQLKSKPKANPELLEWSQFCWSPFVPPLLLFVCLVRKIYAENNRCDNWTCHISQRYKSQTKEHNSNWCKCYNIVHRSRKK